MRTLSIWILLLLCLQLHAQQFTVRQAFVEMPDTLLPYLSNSNRLDLLDYLDAKMKAEVDNELEGRTTLVSMGEDSLVLHLNDLHQLTLYVLDVAEPIDSSLQVIAAAHTYRLSTGEEDHTLCFYSRKWVPLNSQPALTPQQAARLPRCTSSLLRRDDDVLNRKPVEF
ncbi:MAG: DUF3256 family protein [Prevotella sp.]|nr:DUF3256 family protein [Prevotella sp.]